MRLLITGSSGRLGIKLIKYCKERFEVIPTYTIKKIHEDAVKMDFCSKDGVERVFKTKPDIVIHTAAMTDVDACEVDKENAWLVNVIGTRNLAEATEKISGKLVYISTDYVFDGKKGMYKESDETNPINYYGTTKLEGEKIIEKTCKNFIIARSSVLYGLHPFKLDFISWLVKELKEGKVTKIVTDQFISPTLTDDLAGMILELIKRDKVGIYHAAGRERINRFNLAVRVAETFNLNKNLITQTTSDKMDWKAIRPRDSSLDVSKISKINPPLNIQEGLEFLKKEMV